MVAILIICPPDLSFIYSCNSDYLRQQKLISFRFANRLEFSAFAERSPTMLSGGAWASGVLVNTPPCLVVW